MALVAPQAPWYPRPGVRRLDSASVQRIAEVNRDASGLGTTFQLVERRGDGLDAYGHLFEGKYYACCANIWVDKGRTTYSISCGFADIQGVYTTRNIPMAAALVDFCDLAMGQIVEWLALGILQPRPLQVESISDVTELLASMDKEVWETREDGENDCDGFPVVVFVPVYPGKVGIEELHRHFTAEAELTKSYVESAIVLDGSPMDSLTGWMTQADQLRAFELSWDCGDPDPSQGWIPLETKCTSKL